MPSDRNLGVDDAPNQVCALLTALNLHSLGTALLHKASRISHRFFRTQMVRAVRHIDDQERILYSSPDRPGMMQHLVRCDGKRVVITEHRHGQRVADQDYVDARLVYQACTGVVVGSKAGNGLVLKFLFSERYSSDFLARFTNRCETHDVLQCPSASADRACYIFDC